MTPPSVLLCVLTCLALRYLGGIAYATDTYDYIIIGGGPAGLTVADRLSKDGSKNVLVLEAGAAHINDPKIMIPGNQGSTVGDPNYDWLFTTVPQPGAFNRSVVWNRGKVLGGSTAINFMVFGRPSSAEIDGIASMGNPGWEWDNLFKYIKKAESFMAPSALATANYNFTYNASYHGTTGPVKNSYSAFVSEAQLPWTSAFNELGVATLPDPLGGNDVGVYYTPCAIDNTTKTRSYATTAHYLPHLGRKNLIVITGAMASRILTGSASGSLVPASGVEYFVNGTRTIATLTSAGEVIVSAGTIGSPKILELSGIGDPAVLKPLGIPVTVDLPGVGNNVADHIYFGVSFELKNSSTVTLDNLRDPAFAAQAMAEYNANKTGIYTIGVSASSLIPLQAMTDTITAAKLIAAQTYKILTSGYSAQRIKLLSRQIFQLLDPATYGLVEFVIFPGFFTSASTPKPGSKYITITVDYHLPMSRGSTHVASTNYTVQPTINPNYLDNDFDLQVMLLSLKFARKIAAASGFKELLATEIDPGPTYTTDDQLITYIRQNLQQEPHTVGTSAMLPRDQGGVVSPKLKVYGTSNIRVVDLSILPIQITAHPQSTVYGIAEKAADIIRGTITV